MHVDPADISKTVNFCCVCDFYFCFFRELLDAKQAKRAQALENMLSSVQMTLDEQFSTSQTLHSSIMAQLQTFHTQV